MIMITWPGLTSKVSFFQGETIAEGSCLEDLVLSAVLCLSMRMSECGTIEEVTISPTVALTG